MSKEREDFEKSIAANIENFCDAAFDGKYYVMRNNSRLKQRDKEFLILSLNRSWSAWQAAKVEAVPEGFGDIQSWIAVNSFSALDASMDDFLVVDANELAKYIDSLIEPKQPASTSGCPDEP